MQRSKCENANESQMVLRLNIYILDSLEPASSLHACKQQVAG